MFKVKFSKISLSGSDIFCSAYENVPAYIQLTCLRKWPPKHICLILEYALKIPYVGNRTSATIAPAISKYYFGCRSWEWGDWRWKYLIWFLNCSSNRNLCNYPDFYLLRTLKWTQFLQLLVTATNWMEVY